MKLEELTTGDRVIGASGLFLLAVSFFNWLGKKPTGPISVDPTTAESKNAWAFPVTAIAAVIGSVMLLAVVLKLLGANQPTVVGRFSWSQVLALAGVTAFLLIAIKLAVGPGTWTDVNGHKFTFEQLNQLCRGLNPSCEGVSKTRGLGIILGVIAAAGLAIGGYLRTREDMTTSL